MCSGTLPCRANTRKRRAAIWCRPSSPGPAWCRSARITRRRDHCVIQLFSGNRHARTKCHHPTLPGRRYRHHPPSLSRCARSSLRPTLLRPFRRRLAPAPLMAPFQRSYYVKSRFSKRNSKICDRMHEEAWKQCSLAPAFRSFEDPNRPGEYGTD